MNPEAIYTPVSETVWTTIDAQPQAWQRARIDSRNGRVFTAKKTDAQKRLWRRAWGDTHGDLSLGEGPILVMGFVAVFARPVSHFRKNGELSAAGLRALFPYRGDLDNLLKLPLDALNGIAYKDDVQIVGSVGLNKVYSDDPSYTGGVFLGLARARRVGP